MILTRYANRGNDLEEWVEQANRVYYTKNLAVITKIPTSWKIQRGYSPKRKRYEIYNAFPEKKSTVDFGGMASTQSIWFDAKSTENKLSFPLSNIHEHQTEFLEKISKQGGKAFFLIHSKQVKKTWVLWIDQLFNFKLGNDRKSIPFTWLEENCEVVPSGIGVMLDYLPIVLKRKFYKRNEG